MAKIES